MWGAQLRLEVKGNTKILVLDDQFQVHTIQRQISAARNFYNAVTNNMHLQLATLAKMHVVTIGINF